MSLVIDEKRNNDSDGWVTTRRQCSSMDSNYYKCSNCNKWLYWGEIKKLLKKYKFCPYCGVKHES